MTSFEVFPVVKEIFCPDVLRSGAPKLNKKNCSEKDIVLSKRGTDSVTVVYKTSPLADLHLYIGNYQKVIYRCQWVIDLPLSVGQ